MSAEPEQNQNPQPAASPEAGAAPAQETSQTTEAPAIRVGNSGAHMQRANEEIARQLRAAEEGNRSPSSADDADPASESGPTEGGQPTTPTPTPQEPSEVDKLRQRLEELEQERTQERETKRAAELQTLNQQQQREYLDLQADVEAAQRKAQRDEARLNNLALEYQTAVAERDYETVEALTQAYQEQAEDLAISQRAALRLQQQQQQFKAYADNQYHEAHIREQASQIGKIASKYGLTPDDLKAANPKLDITKPFEVLDTVAAALHKKMTGTVSEKDKALKDQESKLRDEYREQFDNSPGAQPHPGGSTNTNTSGGLSIKFGNSGPMIRKAFGIKD